LFRTIPLASFYDARQGTIKMDYNQGKKVMMTVGTDRTIKVSFFIQINIFINNWFFFHSSFGTCHQLCED